MRRHSPIREYWVRHLRKPVRFSAGLRQLLQDMPDSILIEAGPGQGLCALARQNSPGQARTILASTSKAQEPNADLALMLTGAGALWTRGVTPDWAALRNRHGLAASRCRPTLSIASATGSNPASARSSRRSTREAATPASPAVTRLASYDDWFRVPEWTRAPAPPRTRSRATSGWCSAIIPS